MGHRLTRITTRRGDGGATRLGNGSEVEKDHPRIIVLGELDELNSALGAVLAGEMPADLRAMLAPIQHELFDLGAALCRPEAKPGDEEPLRRMEDQIERLNAELGPLKEFILPGGTRPAAAAHLARTICRRAERALVALHKREPVPEFALKYLNRLSDLLFNTARMLNRAANHPETLWQPRPVPAAGTTDRRGT
jgi:cob(I)alamin adenosyltransferase